MSKVFRSRKGFFSHFIKILSVIIVLILIIVPVIFGLIIYFNSPGQPKALSEETDGIRRLEDGAYYIDIRRGESAQSVGLRLERAGFIRNRYFWSLIARYEKEPIKAGTYRLENNLTQIAIYRIFIEGRQAVQRLTIKEGVTLSKTARLLEEANICSAADFMEAARDPDIISHYRIPNQSMEGYLFPDTYFFPLGYPADKVVRTMADNFFRKIMDIDPSIADMTPKELNDKVILASIVEREYRIAEEAPLMAGVFSNRLRINMGLQSCATVEYIITEIMGLPHPRVITGNDLQIVSPYNTYMWAGLPPGPISAPGTVALRAAFFPQRTEYFYFRLDDPAAGRHIFSRTLEEHRSRAGVLATKDQS